MKSGLGPLFIYIERTDYVMKMLKRLITSLLVSVIVITSIPITSFAEETGLPDDSQESSDMNGNADNNSQAGNTVGKGGDFAAEGGL